MKISLETVSLPIIASTLLLALTGPSSGLAIRLPLNKRDPQYSIGGGSPGFGGSSPGFGGSSPGVGGSSPGVGGSSPGTGGSSGGGGGGGSSPGVGGSSPGTGGSSGGGGGSSGGGGGGGSSGSGGSSGGGGGSSGSGGSSGGGGGSSGSGGGSSGSGGGSSGSGGSGSGSGGSGSGSGGSGSGSGGGSSGSGGSGSGSSGSGSGSSGSGSGSSGSGPGSSGSSSSGSGSDNPSSYSGSASYDGGDTPQQENDGYLVNAAYTTSCTAGVPQQANDATVNLMEGYETFQPNPYDDGYGNPTVGYGHLCSDAACSGTGFTYPMTPGPSGTATQLFNQDIGVAETCITQHVQVPLNANQYGALVSWAFNTGCPHIAGSTLFKQLNAGMDPNTVAAAQLPKWKYASGQVSQGLINRRNSEVNLFQTPSSDQGVCP